MKVLFFTDPHIGIRRSSHTTVASQEKLRTFLFEEVMKMLEEQRQDFEPYDLTVCLGDLFDLYSNKEDIIAQGAQVVRQCDFILAGNHDLRNNVNTTSSLQLLAKMDSDNEEPKFVISPDGSKPYARTVDICEEHALAFVPHCFDQATFEESIDLAIKQKQKDVFTILCLHCNVGEGFGHAEAEGTTLYLTDAMQSKINKHFDLCVVGHEHVPKKTKKIVTLGNFFPVSFGEVADRFVYVFDTETRELEKIKTFDAADQWVEFNVFDLLESGGEIDCAIPLVEIEGEIEAKSYPDLSRALLKFWRHNEDSLFAVKNSVVVERPNDIGRQKDSKTMKMSLIDVVKGSAKKADFDEELAVITQEIEQGKDNE